MKQIALIFAALLMFAISSAARQSNSETMQNMPGGAGDADGKNAGDARYAGHAAAEFHRRDTGARYLRHQRPAQLDSRPHADDEKGLVDADVPRQRVRGRPAAIRAARRGQILLHKLADGHGATQGGAGHFYDSHDAESRARHHNRPAVPAALPAGRNRLRKAHRGRAASSRLHYGAGRFL